MSGARKPGGRSFLLPLVLAAVAGGATFMALNRSAGPAAATTTERVLVADRPIEAGAAFGAADVRLDDIPRAVAPPDAVHDAIELSGVYAAAAIPKGAVIRRADASATVPGSRLATLIPDGKVAVTIAANDVINAGGFIAPGDRVDVLGVVTKEAADAAVIVIRDVQVLAVSSAILGTRPQPPDTKSGPAGRNDPNSIDGTVTLAVSIQDAQKLVQVDELGKIRLALRRPAGGGAAVYKND